MPSKKEFIKKDLYVWSLGTKLIQNVSNTSRHISQAYEMTVTYRDLIDHGGVLLYTGYEMILLESLRTFAPKTSHTQILLKL